MLDPHAFFDDANGPEHAGAAPTTLSSYLQECERHYLLQELTHHDWHMAETAKAIGISRKNLWERLRRLDLQLPGRADRHDPVDDES